jgi:hypothetical protein
VALSVAFSWAADPAVANISTAEMIVSNTSPVFISLFPLKNDSVDVKEIYLLNNG